MLPNRAFISHTKNVHDTILIRATISKLISVFQYNIVVVAYSEFSMETPAMQVKVFISYSHKDETFKESLNEHLSMLKRNELISEWHDRQIIAGDNWKGQISKNLEEAQLILFLVSSSFLSSEYCFDIEFKRALEKHHEGSAQLIPIVVRPCDWTTSELGSFQGLPKDALPITKWNDQDEAWLNVVHGVKQRVTQFKPKLAGSIDSAIDQKKK